MALARLIASPRALQSFRVGSIRHQAKIMITILATLFVLRWNAMYHRQSERGILPLLPGPLHEAISIAEGESQRALNSTSINTALRECTSVHNVTLTRPQHTSPKALSGCVLLRRTRDAVRPTADSSPSLPARQSGACTMVASIACALASTRIALACHPLNRQPFFAFPYPAPGRNLSRYDTRAIAQKHAAIQLLSS